MNDHTLSFTGCIKKGYRFFKSLRLTAALMVLLIVTYFLGLILPQRWMFDSDQAYWMWTEENFVNKTLHFIGFTDIYLSPFTIALLALFFLNLFVVTLNRVPIMLKRAYLLGETPWFSSGDLRKRSDVNILHAGMGRSGTVKALSEFFRRRKWYFREGKAGNTYFAVKNRYSPIGFILFHFSFFLCLMGGLMIMYTRFSGKLPLTEGQRFDGDISQFRTIIKDPKVIKKLPPIGLYLRKVEPTYENDVPTELVTYVAVRYEDEIRNEVLRVNEPIKRGPMSILVESIGVSPLFVVKGPGGREIDAAYTSLNVLNGREDSFQFDTDRRFTFYVKFFPDYTVENGIEKTRSIELKNPAIRLAVEKEGVKIYEGTIRKGEPAQLDLFSISFEDIRYWAEFLMVREYGKLPLIAGFVMASIGLIMRLVFYQKSLRFAFNYEGEKPILYMDGRSEYFHHSYKDEKEKIAGELEGYLSNAMTKDTGVT